MKKLFTYRNVTIFLLVIIIALSSALIITNNKLQDTENSLAEHNKTNWNQLAILTKQAQSIADKEISKFSHYQKGVIYSVAFNLYPHYTLEGNDLSHFLTAYDQFLKDIQNNDLSEEKYNEAIELYVDTSKEIYTLCSFVLKYCEDDKAALLDSESTESKEINQKIKALTEKYEPKFYGFFNK